MHPSKEGEDVLTTLLTFRSYTKHYRRRAHTVPLQPEGDNFTAHDKAMQVNELSKLPLTDQPEHSSGKTSLYDSNSHRPEVRQTLIHRRDQSFHVESHISVCNSPTPPVISSIARFATAVTYLTIIAISIVDFDGECRFDPLQD